MLPMVAVLPQPPLLVPELATGAAAGTASLRAACREAAARLAAASPTWVAVGADSGGRRTVEGVRGTFAGFGADVVVALDPAAEGEPDRAMALPLLVAGWAAEITGAGVTVRGELLDPAAPPAECAALGTRLATGDAALLVVGDGAICHTEKAPGHLDVRAAGFDAAVAAALRDGDPAALAALDVTLANELGAVGRAPWQVLAAAATGRRWHAELLYSEAPFGVAYHVAVWTPVA